MAKTDSGKDRPEPRVWTDLKTTPLKRTVWVHLASMITVLITQILLGITRENDSVILFGLGLVLTWMAIEATAELTAFTGLPLTVLTIATALEVNQYPDAPWIIISLTAGLVAWDTHHLLRRGNAVDHIERPREIENSHLRRLLLVSGIGSAAGVTAMLIRVNLGFGLALVLGLLAIYSIGQVIRYLRNHTT